VGAAGAHHRCPDNAEVWHVMGKAEPVDHVGPAIITHSGPTIGMRGGSHRAGRSLLHRYSAGLHEPLRHLVLDEGAQSLLIVFVVGGDADYREAHGVFHDRIEVEIVVLVRQRRFLQIGDVEAVGILLDEGFPRSSQLGALP
jgi:hypothetical protein